RRDPRRARCEPAVAGTVRDGVRRGRRVLLPARDQGDVLRSAERRREDRAAIRSATALAVLRQRAGDAGARPVLEPVAGPVHRRVEALNRSGNADVLLAISARRATMPVSLLRGGAVWQLVGLITRRS